MALSLVIFYYPDNRTYWGQQVNTHDPAKVGPVKKQMIEGKQLWTVLVILCQNRSKKDAVLKLFKTCPGVEIAESC